jgi:hypothetical protein
MAAPKRSPIASGVLFAVASALSFGVTIPLVARFGVGIGPLTTAGLLYAGAMLVSLLVRSVSARSGRSLTRAALPRLLAPTRPTSIMSIDILDESLARFGAGSCP